MADRPRVVLVVTLAAAVGLAGAWLAAPPMGTDLSAQVARADFFAGYGFAPVDFRWYGGVSPLGYSLVSPPLMGWLGPRPVGALAAVVSSLALAVLLLRTGARRPLLGGVLGAAGFAGNLVSGRVTFALGVALGLLALVALVALVPRRAPLLSPGREEGSPAGAGRLLAAGLLAALAAAASPVAGLFLALAGTALFLSGRWRSLPAGGALLAGVAVPTVVMAGLFGSGGWMNISRSDMTHATVASLAVAVLVPHRVVRVGALLSAGGVVAAYLLTTPVGLNATRLATMFALPLVAAYATVPAGLQRAAGRVRLGGLSRPVVWLPPVLALLAWWQPPVLTEDLAGAGDPAASPGYFAPLREELARREPAGRVEVVPTANYWESAYLDPLARGWLRQADLRWNPLFFDGSLDAGSYQRWLADNGVSHVALSRDTASWVGRREAELIGQGLPYLTAAWENETWILYEVEDSSAIVEGPAVVRRVSPDAVVFEATGSGEVLLRVRWSQWLAVSGPDAACLARAGEWTTVRVDGPGEYQVTSVLISPGPHC